LIFFLNLKIDIKQQKAIKRHKANVEFYNSILYDINNNEVSKIIQSKQAFSYKNKDELYTATIILKSKNSVNSISADYIQRRNVIYKFYDNVYLNKGEDFSLSTDFLVYDEFDKILKNDTRFIINYKNSIMMGQNLYYDLNKEYLQALNVEFKINQTSNND